MTMDVLLAGCLAVYFAPCVVASWKEHPREGWIFVLTLLTGWTGIGWAAALIWAARPVAAQEEPAVLARREHLRLLAGGRDEIAGRRPPRRSGAAPEAERSLR